MRTTNHHSGQSLKVLLLFFLQTTPTLPENFPHVWDGMEIFVVFQRRNGQTPLSDIRSTTVECPRAKKKPAMADCFFKVVNLGPSESHGGGNGRRRINQRGRAMGKNPVPWQVFKKGNCLRIMSLSFHGNLPIQRYYIYNIYCIHDVWSCFTDSINKSTCFMIR